VLVTALDVRHEAPFLDLTDEAWTEVLDGTVKAAFLASQDAARAMRDAGGGVIVHVTSDLPLRPPRGAAAHAAAQAALQMMSTTMALDLAPDNVRVCAVAAPESDTDVTDEDVAAVVAFCASGEASYVLGSVFHPGGGAPVRS
jgi:3-oxoacyl-[acyl-carrier protein] reductase